MVYFGLLNASKGLDVLVEVFEHVARARTARLVLVGGSAGASDATDQATARAVEPWLAQLGERVVRSGFRSADAVSAYLLAGRRGAAAVRDGASPRRGSLLACAEHGLPIVSTRPVSAAVADAVLAVPAGDARALGEAVLRVATTTRWRKAARGQSGAGRTRELAAHRRTHAGLYAHL